MVGAVLSQQLVGTGWRSVVVAAMATSGKKVVC